jgi:hypothetical protein
MLNVMCGQDTSHVDFGPSMQRSKKNQKIKKKSDYKDMKDVLQQNGGYAGVLLKTETECHQTERVGD